MDTFLAPTVCVYMCVLICLLACITVFIELNNKLGVVERVATRIHTETDELAADVEDFGAAIKQWSLNESELVSPIQQMGTCLDNCSMALRQLVGVA